MKWTGTWIALPCAGLLALAAAGCGQSAHITRTNGGTVKAKIEDSDAHRLHLRSGSKRWDMPRSEVRHIEHPGGTATKAGGVLLALGIGMTVGGGIAVAKTSGGSCDPDTLGCFGPSGGEVAEMVLMTGVALDGLGVGLLLFGKMIRAASQSAAEPPSYGAELSEGPRLRLSAGRNAANIGLAIRL